MHSLSQSLAAVSTRLEREQATEVVVTLTLAMSKRTEPVLLRYLAVGLVSARLGPQDASQACGQAAASLSRAIRETTDTHDFEDLTQGLSAVAARLEPKEAAETATTLIQTILKIKDEYALLYLAQSLAGVATRMEPQEAALAFGQAFATLTQTIHKTKNPNTLLYLWQSLSAVATRLEPKDAASPGVPPSRGDPTTSVHRDTAPPRDWRTATYNSGWTDTARKPSRSMARRFGLHDAGNRYP